MDTSAIDKVLQEAITNQAVPNVVAVAADRNGIIYEGAAGPRVTGGDEPVGLDTHYRIMSMTKMIVTTTALQLMEQGSLDLDAPVAKYCPAFGELQVLEGFDGDTPRLRAPKSQATVKQLITHTSGVGYWFWNADLVRWEASTGTPNVLSGSNVIFGAPLIADPGTRLEYGISTDWLGKVVEAAAGVTLDVAVKQAVTGPLSMGQTEFAPSGAQRDNLVPVHLQDGDGNWSASEIELAAEPEYWAGGHGLHSTPRDYLSFQRALLGGGELDGTRILKQATVEAAFSNQIGALDFPAAIATADAASTADFNAGPGHKWGYGLLLNTEDVPGRRKAGSGSWAGLLNTHFWVDPTSGITGAVYTQFLPFVTPAAYQVYIDVETALYAAL